MKKLYLLIVFLLPFLLFSQTPQEKETNKSIDKSQGYPESVVPSKEYKNATELVTLALEKLKNGEVNDADALINQSIESYPTRNVFEYVRAVCLMPDINKANTIMDKLYQRVNTIGNEKIAMLESFASNIENGVMVKKTRLYEKKRALINYAWDSFKINKEFANISTIIKSYETLISSNIIKKSSPGYDFEYYMQETSKVELELLRGDFDKAIMLVGQIPITDFFPKSSIDNYLIRIYTVKGNYEKAIKMVTKESLHEVAYYKLKFTLNALLGNNEEALENLEKYKKAPYTPILNDIFYYLAIIDLNKKNYENTLINLDNALHHKMEGAFSGMESLFINKWEVYKTMGDAYAGLKQFEKAKDSYNLSLLYYPDYEPAKTALSQLETLIVNTTSTDKTAPTINVTEPSISRGLTIVSINNDILVKGLAADPSGLKSVTINGQNVYAQADGNFWGNVILKEGSNKITIKATDGAGNSAEQTFEIQKKSNASPTEIVPVTVKEGKNYCLLIGAQNYEDISIPSLENPIQDAVRLKLILKNDYAFDDSTIISLFNPTANDVKRQLLELTNTIQPEDNLLIFYAGHGIWVEKEKKGYWLLIDAKRSDPTTWLQNKEVLNLIAKLPSRHTLLITDACFSGGVFKTRSIGKDAPANIKTMNEKISRVAITSGNDTEVPDESVFMKYLVKALSENKEKYLTAQKMFITQIMEAVMIETKTEPRYGTLELAGHIGGDYIFMKK